MDERDQYRKVFRTTREGLTLLDDLLTESQRDAILREATRTARRKEHFWLAVAAIGGGVIYFVLDAISSFSQYKFVALLGYFAVSYVIAMVSARRSRIQLIPKEVMAILRRKQIRPPFCLGCGVSLRDNGSLVCMDCGCELSEKTASRH